MVDIIIFGTGAIADCIFDQYLDFTKVRILTFMETDCDSGKEKRGYSVVPVTQINEFCFDFVLIAADAYDAIHKQLQDEGVPKDRIIGLAFQRSNLFSEIVENINIDAARIFNLYPTEKLFKKALPGIEATQILRASSLYLDHHNIESLPEKVDSARMMTLHALSREIKLNNVEGSVAELGVYRGEFASAINELFPDRTFYLFDTFEGFSVDDLEYDKDNNYSNPAVHFGDTSVELVLSKMPYKDKCKIVKGYFPESASNVNDDFAFVSIDADLYLPILRGLEFFYERLSRNGYILVHDFNYAIYPGAREAVVKFCREKKIGYCPVADYYGSVVITK